MKVPKDFFPNQTYLTFDETWSQWEIAEHFKDGFDEPRPTASTGSHKKGSRQYRRHSTEKGIIIRLVNGVEIRGGIPGWSRLMTSALVSAISARYAREMGLTYHSQAQ